MQDIIKNVYAVFGNKLPSRSTYSATADKPFPALTITKSFKTWSKFEIAYKTFAIQERAAIAARKTIVKKIKEVSNEIKK
jgi:hypothetical protein